MLLKLDFTGISAAPGTLSRAYLFLKIFLEVQL